MQKKYDAVLYFKPQINEATGDSRIYNRGKAAIGGLKGFNQNHVSDDPKMYNTYTFGNMVRQSLNNMSAEYSCQVTDFKKWVVVTVTHNNIITGKSSSKTFLIVFDLNKEGIVLSTHNRYRTISGVDQAISYIKSSCQALQSDTQNRIG